MSDNTSNAHPEDPELLKAEARLRKLLGETEVSLKLLEKAWAKMPRGSGVARQLARTYLSNGDTDRALEILHEAISREPNDRSLNLMVSNVIFSGSGDIHDSVAKNYLLSSFASGDREYWGRFVRAAHAYSTREFEESQTLFSDIKERAPTDFKPRLGAEHQWLVDAMKNQSGAVAKSFGSYLYITPTDGPDRLYAPDWGTADLDLVRVRSEVHFDVNFNRRGPYAQNVRLAK